MRQLQPDSVAVKDDRRYLYFSHGQTLLLLLCDERR